MKNIQLSFKLVSMESKLFQFQALKSFVFYYFQQQAMLNYKSTVASQTKMPFASSNMSQTRVPSSSRSPERSSGDFSRTPQRSGSSQLDRLQQARDDLEDVVGESLQVKRQLWKDGADQVYRANEEIADMLGQNQQGYPSYSNKKGQSNGNQRGYYPSQGNIQDHQQNLRGYDQDYQRNTPNSSNNPNRQDHHKSSYEPYRSYLENQLNESYPVTEFKHHLNRPNLRAPVSQFVAQPVGQEETFSVRKRLTEQMRKNNQMMDRLAQLELENSNLRSTTAGNRTPNQSYELKQENQNLRQRIAQLESSNIPDFLYDQMDELKAENQQLRQDVKKLLKAKGL